MSETARRSGKRQVKGGIGMHALRTQDTDRVKGGIGMHALRTR